MRRRDQPRIAKVRRDQHDRRGIIRREQTRANPGLGSGRDGHGARSIDAAFFCGCHDFFVPIGRDKSDQLVLAPSHVPIEQRSPAVYSARLFMNEIYDVAIIGGGPAGSTAACLLAKAGRRVVVLEREKFPRFHIGESLLPYSMPVFDRLGIREELDRTAQPKHGAELITACGTRHVNFHFRDGFRLAHHRSYQVERATFDKLLLDNAAEHGAEVREETAVPGVDFDDDGATVRLAGQDAPTIRAPLRHRRQRPQYRHRPATAASRKATRICKNSPSTPTTKMSAASRATTAARSPAWSAREDRWFWVIPLSDTQDQHRHGDGHGDFQAMAPVARGSARSPASASSRISRTSCADAKRVTPVYATGDYSYRNTRLAGPRWLLAGDAAGFIDPVFSTGVFLAIASGEQAADAIHASLERPAQSAPAFSPATRNGLNRVMDLYLRFVNSWYQHEFIEVISQPDRDTFSSPARSMPCSPAISTAASPSGGACSSSISWSSCKNSPRSVPRLVAHPRTRPLPAPDSRLPRHAFPDFRRRPRARSAPVTGCQTPHIFRHARCHVEGARRPVEIHQSQAHGHRRRRRAAARQG